jgi:hypothetical protein
VGEVWDDRVLHDLTAADHRTRDTVTGPNLVEHPGGARRIEVGRISMRHVPDAGARGS